MGKVVSATTVASEECGEGVSGRADGGGVLGCFLGDGGGRKARSCGNSCASAALVKEISGLRGGSVMNLADRPAEGRIIGEEQWDR